LTKEELQARSKQLGIEVYKLCKRLDKGLDTNVFGHQLLRSASSVGANYRAACRARSSKEFIAKLSICIEECDEVMFWLEFLDSIGSYGNVNDIRDEANQLLSIFIASRKTVANSVKNQKS
tara:strand:+ start:111 stop:473 length:363 start_codon:yes stop_codon:yes gene_type:complete